MTTKSRFYIYLRYLASLLVFLTIPLLKGLAVPASTITISFIDVGQGDAFLIRDSTGFDILIDGGKTSAGPTVLAYLRSQGVDDIEVMLATHADSDHIGGLINILDATDIPVESVFYNGYPGSTATWDDFVSAVSNEGILLNTAQYPASFNWGQMTAIILNPITGMSNPNQNDASVVVLLQFGQNRLLLSGDISSVIEAQILTRGIPVSAEILKVAHHGSSTSSSSSFLAQVVPQNAVISVGNNSYGHPAPETLARLQAAGATIWRTDLDGTIIVSCDGIVCTFLPFLPGSHLFLPAVLQSVPGNVPATTGNILITNLFYNGSGTTEPDEFVEIKNVDGFPIQLQNFILKDIAGHTFIFPNFVIQPNQVCRVYTNEIHSEWCSFNYGQNIPIWNNSGDCAYLWNAQNILMHESCY